MPLNWQPLLAVWYSGCVSCSFGTGLAGKMVGKTLHTNYSKKQNSKSPQSVFKIYSQLLSLVTFIIYRRQGDGRCIENLVWKPQGKVSVHRHIMAVIIVLRLILTWFYLRPNDKGFWMWQWTYYVYKCKELDHLCKCQHHGVHFWYSPCTKSCECWHVLWPVVLFCSLLWPMSPTSK